MRRRRLLRFGLFALAALSVGLLVALVPIAWIESSCMKAQVDDVTPYQPVLAPEHRRPETNTFVTYPEWLIVHVYEDYAAVSRTRGEAAFPYFSSIDRYWSNLCVMTQHASARGEITGDSKAMLYTIGVSFSVEMAVKGSYERTIGWLTEALSGNEATPEDVFARSVAEDYAVFIVQRPWYEYPFGKKLRVFWTDAGWSEGNLVRKLERRISVSLEFGAKALYAQAIDALAGLSPSPLRIRSVVRGLDPGAASEPDVQRVEKLADWQVIETPRYRDFTHIVRRLALGGVDLIEIAGNDEVFVTLLLPPGAPETGGEPLITAQVSARPGWQRSGVLVKVAELAALVRQLSTQGGELEHVYEY